jgi:PST family polysaccharide transporter
MIVGFALMIFAAQGGLVLVAAAFTARFYILWPIRFYVVRNVGGVDIKEYLKIVIGPILGSSIMAVTVFGWQYLLAEQTSNSIILSSSLLVGLSIYAVFAWVVMRVRILRATQLVKSMWTPSLDNENGLDMAGPGNSRRSGG